MMRRTLTYLTAVESLDRDVGCHHLPSWVADLTTNQQHHIAAMRYQSGTFCAHEGFPALEEGRGEPRWQQDDSDPVLVIRGRRVGHITEVKNVPLNNDTWVGGYKEGTIRLFGYEAAGVRHNIGDGGSGPITIRGESWQPCKANVGDMIIVSPGSYFPLVLRRVDDKVLLVGACKQIDSELQTVEQFWKSEKVQIDPGYSPIMFGSACLGMKSFDVEFFHIY
ncbi:hypothetical protein GGTG_06576 [Gaeumannomyces tritici R3-111a-1]|uniref:Uncharacterized protein n=1 Tax=Gaeumannomyces tritici (strain R3-111a-1) TaxID=644352 RepID=J3NZ76_GAET3|nr:hypothetical protein GGTG_06576 [Gaeumannomyces tritici R3-111a-1]EJT76659.1 hypothetical protein GGTG_06576 [Gaeumannomyces tritici R3-111a-1]